MELPGLALPQPSRFTETLEVPELLLNFTVSLGKVDYISDAFNQVLTDYERMLNMKY